MSARDGVPGGPFTGVTSLTSHRPDMTTAWSFKRIVNRPAVPTAAFGTAGTTTSVWVAKRAKRSTNSSAEAHFVASCMTAPSAPTDTSIGARTPRIKAQNTG
jgi:hypothetical protein